MIAEPKLMTAEEFYERAPKNERSELVRGEMIRHSFLTMDQGECVANLAFPLARFIKQTKAGRSYLATGFVLARNPDTVRAPRFAFASKRGKRTDKDFFFDGAPDLAVEVASPSESSDDIQDKVIDYLEAGTRMVIYLHPRTKTITVYYSLDNIRVLTLKDTLDGGDVLPGFSVLLKEIFIDD